MSSPLSPETGTCSRRMSSLLVSHAGVPSCCLVCKLICQSMVRACWPAGAQIKDSTCPLCQDMQKGRGSLSHKRDGWQALHHPTVPAPWWVSHRDGMLPSALAGQGKLCLRTDCFMSGTAKATAVTNILSPGFPCQACEFPTYLVTILEMHPSALSSFRWYLLCTNTCAGHTLCSEPCRRCPGQLWAPRADGGPVGISSRELQAVTAQGLRLCRPQETSVAETTRPRCLGARHSPPIHEQQCPGQEPGTTYSFLHHPPFGCP